MTSGLHHITAITRKIQANVDFYCGFLACASSSAPAVSRMQHSCILFYYGDAVASPGSLVSFLAWETGPRGVWAMVRRVRSPPISPSAIASG